jgi:hypothetical protein
MFQGILCSRLCSSVASSIRYLSERRDEQEESSTTTGAIMHRRFVSFGKERNTGDFRQWGYSSVGWISEEVGCCAGCR